MPHLHRQALVVLGMHRSGTSAVAGTAVRLGFSGPRTPLPASADNPDGFTEPAPVVEANHRMLLAAGCAWNLCLTLDPEQVGRMLGREDQLRALQTLQGQFGHAAAFVLKDPRLCLTLPAWLPALGAMGARPSVLLVVRHPAEVVRSLAVRNRLEATETAPNWLHHMLEAERMSRSFGRAVVLYDDLLRDWRSCMEKAGQVGGIAWPRPVEQAAADIGRFLQGTRRHHVATDAAPAVGPVRVRELIGAAWIALRRLADNPGSPDALACLDHVRTRFAVWRREVCPPGYRVVLPGS